MITQNRWQHILGVARKCKALAFKFKPADNKFAEDILIIFYIFFMAMIRHT